MNDEVSAIREAARRFAAERLMPFGRDWDRSCALPAGLLEDMGSLGLLGLRLPQAYGGSGSTMAAWVAAVEEIAAGNGGISTIMHTHALGTAGPIARFGTDSQKSLWLPPMIRGDAIGCIGLSEPHAGSDLSQARTRATRVDGGWLLSGAKQFITNGSRAKIAIILAVTDPIATSRGKTFFLVPTDTEGFIVGKVEDKMGQRVSDTAEIILQDCFVPDSAILGELNQALPAAMGLLSDGRISVAAQAVGMARAAFEAAVEYAKTREAFGQVIAKHQAIAFQLADMATDIEAARAMTEAAARMFDTGEECTKQASMAKLFATRAAERVCSQAIQIFGGYGYLKDYPVERIYRDVKVTQIYEGTNEIQQLIIARKIID